MITGESSVQYEQFEVDFSWMIFSCINLTAGFHIDISRRSQFHICSIDISRRYEFHIRSIDISRRSHFHIHSITNFSHSQMYDIFLRYLLFAYSLTVRPSVNLGILQDRCPLFFIIWLFPPYLQIVPLFWYILWLLTNFKSASFNQHSCCLLHDVTMALSSSCLYPFMGYPLSVYAAIPF